MNEHAHLHGETQQTNAPDRISLRDYITSADIGAFGQERGEMQRLRVTIIVDVSTRARDAADNVDRILSYDVLTKSVETALGERRLDLLETLAERIAQLILAEPTALLVFVRLEKLDRGPGALGVEITRREAGQGSGTDLRSPSPVIVVLGRTAMEDPQFESFLGRVEDYPSAVIMVAPAPELPLPQAKGETAREAIRLLARDQAAWALAGQDPRCEVITSMTELEWACDHPGTPYIWAPARLMGNLEGGDLSAEHWLAEQLGALEVICVTGAPASLDASTFNTRYLSGLEEVL